MKAIEFMKKMLPVTMLSLACSAFAGVIYHACLLFLLLMLDEVLRLWVLLLSVAQLMLLLDATRHRAVETFDLCRFRGRDFRAASWWKTLMMDGETCGCKTCR